MITLQEPAALRSTMTFSVVDPLARPDWDRFLGPHPDATFFHSRAWAQVLVTSYGFSAHYVVAHRDGTLCGLLPILESRSWMRGTRAISLPFTDDCRALTSDAVNTEQLLDAGSQLARTRGWQHLELNCAQAQPTHFTHTLLVDSSPAEMLARCQSPVRRAIRKAERSGVSVDFSRSAAALREYYRLHCRTRRRLGSPPQPIRFFDAIQDHILSTGHGFVALARHAGRIIAGAVFFEFAGQVIYKFSASDERFQDLRPANLVIWRTLERLAAEGAKELSFGRTSLRNEGLRRFKLGWGARESVVCRARYDFNSRCSTPLHDFAGGLASRVFSTLPVFVCRWIGAAAYPHLS